MLPNFHILVCGPRARTGNCKLPAWCTRTCPYDCPFPAGFSQVSVSTVSENNLTGGCQRLKALWKVVQVWLGLLRQWREIFLRLGHLHPSSLQWTRDQHSDFLLEPRKGHCRQTQNYLRWHNLAQGSCTVQKNSSVSYSYWEHRLTSATSTETTGTQ